MPVKTAMTDANAVICFNSFFILFRLHISLSREQSTAHFAPLCYFLLQQPLCHIVIRGVAVYTHKLGLEPSVQLFVQPLILGRKLSAAAYTFVIHIRVLFNYLAYDYPEPHRFNIFLIPVIKISHNIGRFSI